ncbi:lamin tail domain-containing protein [Akkermansiaceae bacterium]|nr:lamin tail domain-containing protein [Akkermansiaceae bacterium]
MIAFFRPKTLTLSFLFALQALVSAVPVIESFTTDQIIISPGNSANLSWVVTDFDTISINGSTIDGGETTIPVSPLVTTIYTLTASNVSGSVNAQVTVAVQGASDFTGANGRFIEVVKNSAAATRLHISEIEAFAPGTTPDESDGDGTSGNDLVQNNSSSTETPPTTTTIQHGLASSVIDGDIESGADVWTTLDGQAVQARYMIDLSTTEEIGTIRVFGRGDTCCTDRLQDFTVNIYEDNGGVPGNLVSSSVFPGTAPNGNSGHVELDLTIANPGISSFSVDKTFIPQLTPITLTWSVNSNYTSVVIDQGVGDVTAQTDASGNGSITLNPGPSSSLNYILTSTRPTGTNVAAVSVEVTDQPVIYSLTTTTPLVPPGTTVTLNWDTANVTSLDLNGIDVTGLTSSTVTPASTTNYTLTATNANGSSTEEIQIRVILPGEPLISEFLASNDSGLLDEDGDASDWIELHNPSAQTVFLNGYYLTDDAANLTKWAFPNLTIAPGGYLVVFASSKDRSVAGSELHTNFSLSDIGEYLAVIKQDGTTILHEYSPTYPSQQLDTSYGFDPINAANGFFTTPTPGAENTGGFTDFVADTSFSLDRGFYTNPIQVAITSATVGAQIRYTLDGSKPTATTGLVYSSPVAISTTTVLRAAAFKAGFVPTNVDTQTYIYSADVIAHPNMLTSITQDPVYGPQMENSLQAVPTVSLVFSGDVERSEKETSIELINFEGGSTQLNAGMERFGNYNTNFAKRSMRLTFRKIYGAGKLDFPIFDGHEYPIDPAGQFDAVELRAGNHDMAARGAYLSNRFTDDSMMDMGQIAPHGRFVHVYLNGLYWGQYHLRERWNAAMLSEYFGGTKADYEAINANNTGNQFLEGEVFDGTGVYWNETISLLNGAAPYASAKSHLDMTNMIDFTLLWVSGNSESEFRSAGSVPLGVPFKFFMKDADGYLRNPGHSADHNGPLNAMSKLRAEADPEYSVLVADRIHKHYFNDGAFTPARNIARLQSRIDESQISFYSEAARWNFRTPSSWQSYQDNLVNNDFPNRTATMISRFRAAGMYPALDAPTFSQHGGSVNPGFTLGITAPAGTIYYTIDGSDPREPADPVVVDPPVTILAANAPKTAYVPTTATDGFTDGTGKDWKDSGFNDSTWKSGTSGVGYESGSGYQSYFDIDVQTEMHTSRESCLIRIPFNLPAGALTGKTAAELRIQYDDGYVAYLNGDEIDRQNFVGIPDGDDGANANHSDGAAVVFQTIDISDHLNLFVEGGENILAIHGLNDGPGSSDFLINAELVLSSTPAGGGNGGAISPTAIEFTAAFPIDSTTTIKARVRDGAGTWSAINEAIFFQNPSALVVSELMYSPGAVSTAEVEAGFNDQDEFEFLEIINTGAGPIDLTGITLSEGITFSYSDGDFTTIPAGGRALIVENRAAFEFRYGLGHPIAGQYTGKLNNGGETVTITNQLGDPIRTFTYDNAAPWPLAAAGNGSSMVLNSPLSAPDHTLAANWSASALLGGTPGLLDSPLQSYATWAAGYGGILANGDEDNDGLKNFAEFILLSSPLDPAPNGATSTEIVNDWLSLTITHNLAADAASTGAQYSLDLQDWIFASPFHTTYHADGTATSIYRSPLPISTTPRQFIRARFEDNTP